MSGFIFRVLSYDQGSSLWCRLASGPLQNWKSLVCLRSAAQDAGMISVFCLPSVCSTGRWDD
jgi:hypothetical protein